MGGPLVARRPRAEGRVDQLRGVRGQLAGQDDGGPIGTPPAVVKCDDIVSSDGLDGADPPGGRSSHPATGIEDSILESDLGQRRTARQGLLDLGQPQIAVPVNVGFLVGGLSDGFCQQPQRRGQLAGRNLHAGDGGGLTRGACVDRTDVLHSLCQPRTRMKHAALVAGAHRDGGAALDSRRLAAQRGIHDDLSADHILAG